MGEPTRWQDYGRSVEVNPVLTGTLGQYYKINFVATDDTMSGELMVFDRLIRQAIANLPKEKRNVKH